jgi:hypothetical protein
LLGLSIVKAIKKYLLFLTKTINNLFYEMLLICKNTTAKKMLH